MAIKKKQSIGLREALNTSLQLVFGLIGGVLICAVWLAFKPVTIVDAPPAETRKAVDRHEIIYVRGKPANRGPQGARKQKAFLDRTPGELIFVEEDVNRWISSTYGPIDYTVKVESLGLVVVPRPPLVRMIGDELEVAVEVAMERSTIKRTFVAQTRGKFVQRDDGPVFVPLKVYLGSCPLPWNLGGRILYEKMTALYPVPENVTTAWSAVGHAAVVENRLHLAVGPVNAAPAPAPVPVQLTAPTPTSTIAVPPPALVPPPTPVKIEPAVAPTEPVPAPPAAETVPPAATTEPAASVPAPSDPVPTEPDAAPATPPAVTP